MNISKSDTTGTAWLNSHPVLVYIALFALQVVIFYIIYLNPWVQDHLFNQWINLNAGISGAILNMLGQHVSVYQDSISGEQIVISVKKGCDAVEPMALFVAGIIAFPAPWKNKVIGIGAGLLILFLLNIVRIVALFLTGVYLPSLFEMMHIEVWQVIFILVAMAFWFLWLRWAVIKNAPK